MTIRDEAYQIITNLDTLEEMDVEFDFDDVELESFSWHGNGRPDFTFDEDSVSFNVSYGGYGKEELYCITEEQLHTLQQALETTSDELQEKGELLDKIAHSVATTVEKMHNGVVIYSEDGALGSASLWEVLSWIQQAIRSHGDE